MLHRNFTTGMYKLLTQYQGSLKKTTLTTQKQMSVHSGKFVYRQSTQSYKSNQFWTDCIERELFNVDSTSYNHVNWLCTNACKQMPFISLTYSVYLSWHVLQLKMKSISDNFPMILMLYLDFLAGHFRSQYTNHHVWLDFTTGHIKSFLKYSCTSYCTLNSWA